MKHFILFDLDGTLTDPKIGITKSVQHALKKYGIVEDNLDNLETFIGPPLADSFIKYYGFDSAQALEAIGHYREYFSVTGKFENQVYTGIPELLNSLSANGHTLAVSTSKPTVFARDILEHFGLDGFFEHIVGSNLDNTRTDKAEVIAYTIAQLGCSPADCVMIGDRSHDIIGAVKNQVESIGVSYGYGSPAELEEAGAGRVVASVEELGQALGK